MTIRKVSETTAKKKPGLVRVSRFLATRKSSILGNIGKETYMVLSSLPAQAQKSTVFDPNNEELSRIITTPPRTVMLVEGMGDISCGRPYPIASGLRADNRTSEEGDPIKGNYLEVHSDGYVEYIHLLKPSLDERLGLYFASIHHSAYIVNFMNFIEKIYSLYLPSKPVVINSAIYNAKGMWFAISINSEKTAGLKKKHLEMEKLYTKNLSKEKNLLTKTICDRIWQAFGYEKSADFDDSGDFLYP